MLRDEDLAAVPTPALDSDDEAAFAGEAEGVELMTLGSSDSEGGGEENTRRLPAPPPASHAAAGAASPRTPKHRAAIADAAGLARPMFEASMEAQATLPGSGSAAESPSGRPASGRRPPPGGSRPVCALPPGVPPSRSRSGALSSRPSSASSDGSRHSSPGSNGRPTTPLLGSLREKHLGAAPPFLATKEAVQS